MKKPKIIVYHNTIRDKKVYIVVFINKPFDFDKAKEILNLYSSSKYVSMLTGLNAITFVERKENFDKPLLTMEEFKDYCDATATVITYWKIQLKKLRENE